MQRGWGTLLGRNWYICNSACDPRKQMVLISTFEEQGVESEKPQSLAQSGLCWILCCNMCKCLSKNMLWGTRISSYLRAWVIPTPSLRLHLGFTQCLSEPNGLSGTSLFNSYPLSLSLSQSKHHQSNKNVIWYYWQVSWCIGSPGSIWLLPAVNPCASFLQLSVPCSYSLIHSSV